MALPTITNYSPTGASISWTAFALSYNGLTYSIAAGNSANKFISWIYNAGAPYLSASDSFPVLADADLLLFLNKNGIGLLVPTADVMDGGLVVPGSIYAAAIAADQIQTNHLQANAITSAKIATDAVTASQIVANAIGAEEIGANAVYANHITAGAITVDKLTAGTVGADLVTNGSFEDFDAAGFPLGWQQINAVNGSIAIVSGVSSSGANAARLVATTVAADVRLRQATLKYIPVSSASGRKWHVSARMGAGTAITSGAYLRVNWFDGAKVAISTSDVYANGAISGVFSVYEGQAVPPATAKYMAVEVLLVNPNVTTSLYVDEVAAREVTVSAMIDDGAITTPKLLAGAVVADKIAARAIGADKLIVADLTNFWQNSDFESDTVGLIPAGINPNANCRVRDISAWAGPLGSGAGNGSGRALEIDALSGTNNDVYDTKIYPVTPNDQFYFYFEGRHLNTTGTGITGIGFRTYNQAKAPVTWTTVASFGSTKTTTMTLKEGVFAVPAGTYFIQPWITFANNAETTNKFIVDNIEIRRMNGGELIVDGAIVASKIAASSITADKLLVGDFQNLATINEVYGLNVTSFGQTQVVAGYNQLVNDTGNYIMFKEQVGPVPFKNGEELYYSFTAKATTATTAQVGVYIYNAAGSNKSRLNTAVNIDVTDTPISGTILVPATDAPFGPGKNWIVGLIGTANKGIKVKDVVVRRRNGGELIVDGAITALKISSGEIKTNHMTTNTIDAGVLKSKSITVDKLTITSTDNLAVEADFSNNGASWQLGTYNSVNATAGRGSMPAMRFTGLATQITTLNLVNKFSVGAEDRFRGAMWVKSSAAAASGIFRLVGRFYTTATAFTDVQIASNQAMPTPNTWTNVAGISPVLPAGTIAMELYLAVTNAATGTITDIDYVGLTRAADGSLVVDGAMDAKTITGATIQTAASGARIMLDQTSLNAWNAAGDNYFNMSSATGVNISSVGQSGYDITRYNECTNPSFITDTSGWSSTQTIVRDTAQAYLGAASLKATHTATADRIVTCKQSVYTQNTYTMSAYVFHNAATAKNMRVDFYYTDGGTPTATNIESYTGTVVSVPPNTWTRVTAATPTNGGWPGAAFAIRMDVVGVGFLSTENMWVDAVLWDALYNTVRSYFDGSFAQNGKLSYVFEDSTMGPVNRSEERTARDIKIKSGGNAVLQNGVVNAQAPGIGFIPLTPYAQTAGLFSDGQIVSLIEGLSPSYPAGSTPPLTRVDVGNRMIKLWSYNDISLQSNNGGINLISSGTSGTRIYTNYGDINLNASTSAVNIAAATDVKITGNVLINGDKQALRHVTTQMTVSYPPTATQWGPGTFTRDAALSFNDSCVTFPTNDKIQFNESGVYCISIAVANHSTVNSLSRIYLRNDAGSVTYSAQAKTEANIWEFSLHVPNIYFAAGSRASIMFYQESGGTQQWDTTLRVTKLK